MLKASGSPSMEMKYWNSKNFIVSLTNNSKLPIDLTWALHIFFTVKKTSEIEEISETDEPALFQKDVVDWIDDDPETGKFTMTITPDETKEIWFWDFSYDFKIVWSDEAQYSTSIWIFTIAKVVTQK